MTDNQTKYDESKYRPGLGRSVPHPQRAHLYEIGEDVMDFVLPMCSYGWNRDGGESYSIWRGNIGKLGICKICTKRAAKGLPGVESNFAHYEDSELDLTIKEELEVQKILDKS